MGTPIKDPLQVQSLIESVNHWYHKIELAPGIFTPGVRDCNDVLSTLDSLGLPKNCESFRVLDIGCRDGFFSFEMEARGAEVVAIDYMEVDITGFSVVSQVKNSNVKYFTDNVYNLNPRKYGSFDVILFLGVLYHLRNPMLALDQIRQIIKPDGLLLIETQIATNFILRQLSRINVPVWQFYPGKSLNEDATNKWAPNISGLRAVVEETQFTILKDTIDSNNRAFIIAKAEKNQEKEYFKQLDSGDFLE
ncbi:MAG: class I SAM-dependent methyltransferase [Cyanobacteria bacterium P01_F01_bin.143]